MRNCLFCNISSCDMWGVDNWVNECAWFPPDEMDEEERRNYEEWLEECEENEQEDYP